MVNELLPFLGFVEHHPVGSTVGAVVESYSSHGAYVAADDARGYVPLRLMAEPAPRSARSVMKLGDTVELVVVSFNATRRSIDLCVPGMEPPEVKAVMAAPARPVKRSRKKAPVVSEPEVAEAPAPVKRTRKKAARTADVAEAEPLPPPAATKRTRAKKADAAPVEPAPVSSAPVKRTRKKAAPAAEVEALPPPEPPATPVKRTRKKAPVS
jgi:hypothetical protein